jgi:hypothetical protein
MKRSMAERGSRSTWFSGAAAVLAFGFVLLAAQSIVFTHDLDLDSHVPGHVCDVCVLSADLAGADVPSAPVLVLSSAAHERAETAPVLVERLVAPRPSARGPPTAS